MNITPTTRQITEYSLVLSSDDLARYLADPAQFAADVQAQLNGATPTAPSVRETVRRAAKEAAARKAGPKAASRRKDHEACPICGATYTRLGNLERHIKQVHQKNAGPTKASASSPAPATAAAAT
jgi:hypothetical protein